MHICGPELVIIIVGVVCISQSGDIVGKGIYPYIYNVLIIKGNWNAPLKGGT